jgi:hypothetical protein
MINLAGNKDADKHIKEELYLAGIEAISENAKGEVPYTIVGKIGNWKFRRAWYYWVASVERDEDGLPLDIAVKLHETPHPTDNGKKLGDSIRSGGHCGCPSPAEYGAQPVYNDELDNQLIALGYKKVYSDFIKKEYIPITVGEVSKLCNEGKLTVERYVDCYHIDDQIGLSEFAKTLKSLSK